MSADLTEQRKGSKLNALKLSNAIYGEKEYAQLVKDIKMYAPHTFDINIYNEGRVAMVKDSIRVMFEASEKLSMNTDSEYHAALMHFGYQLPGSIHKGMYVNCIKMLGTDQQKKELLPQCDSMSMIGCYAQTELGHGSDVQSLETVAEFDSKTDEFVLNSPSVSAAKFWPGDLGLYANYALVFARLMSNGNFQGIHSFIVPIRDKNYMPLPGVDVGDIGPKYGFITKDNGFLMLKNVRIPRKNMLRRYVSITETGDLKLKGNPKIAYATMMLMRKLIACGYYKVLGQAVTIAGKYSLIRKQFKDDSGKEIKILDYQLQQNKILSCLADYYAMAINGRILTNLADQNFELVTEKDDDSLMKETHNCLCLGKALSTDLIVKDIEICRLACGGHGFHQYSGLPSLLQEISPFTTLQGQNTVLYLQLARFLLKAHKHAVSGKGSLSNSVQYLKDLANVTKSKVSVPSNDQWNLHDISIIFRQAISFLIDATNQILGKNQAGSAKDIKNQHAAIRLVQLSIMHSFNYYFDNFAKAVADYTECGNIKKALGDVCLLFGINALIGKSFILAQTGLISPEVLASLQNCKENLLRSLRPDAILLFDGIGIPDSAIRSLITSGNIYQNMFNAAKQVSINKEVIPAAHIVKQIRDIKPRL